MGLFDEGTKCVTTGKMRFASPTCEHCGQIVCGYVGPNDGDGWYCMAEVAEQAEQSRIWLVKDIERKRKQAREDRRLDIGAALVLIAIAIACVGYHYLFGN